MDDNDSAQDSASSDDIDFSEEDPSASSAASSSDSASSQSSAQSSSSASAAGSSSPSGSSSSAATPAVAGPAKTGRERIGELDGRLEESMATYDGMILRERDYVLSRANQKGSEEELEAADEGALPYEEAGGPGGEEPYAEGPGGPQGDGGMDSDDGTQNSSSGGGYRPEGGANRQGDYQHGGGGAPPPADIPDGSDDDVVARQIREAAMQETDPELREKLWNEYRKYKSQQSK